MRERERREEGVKTLQSEAVRVVGNNWRRHLIRQTDCATAAAASLASCVGAEMLLLLPLLLCS